jgi:hypothetical protein
VTKKEARRAVAIKLKDKLVRKLELKALQGDRYDGNSLFAFLEHKLLIFFVFVMFLTRRLFVLKMVDCSRK